MADIDHAANRDITPAEESAYNNTAREPRRHTIARLGNRLRRQSTAPRRDEAAAERDRVAEIRDEGGRDRDRHSSTWHCRRARARRSCVKRAEKLRAHAARSGAQAEDRARATSDRVNAARERGRLEAELQAAHLDELTGAYRRKMCSLALYTRSDRGATVRRPVRRRLRRRGPTPVSGTIVTVTPGDRVLQSVVQAMRTRLRSFDRSSGMAATSLSADGWNGHRRSGTPVRSDRDGRGGGR